MQVLQRHPAKARKPVAAERRLRLSTFRKAPGPTRPRRTGSLRNAFQNYCGFRDYLAARNCSIPQPSSDFQKLNVIRGDFLVKGAIPWAALCSARGNSVILVFRNQHDTRPEELAKAPDTDNVEPMAPHSTNYDKFAPRIAGSSSPRTARSGAKPPPINYQRVDDICLEKASSTHYRNKGKWL
jgi:hypothetical protein